MVGRVHLTRQVSLDELRGRYRREKNSRVKERLLAILHLYEGKTVKEVSKIVKRSYRSIERWLGGVEREGIRRPDSSLHRRTQAEAH